MLRVAYLLLLAAVLSSCATSNETAVGTQVAEAEVLMISKVAQQLIDSDAAQAQDCRGYALVKKMMGNSLSDLTEGDNSATYQAVMDVWKEVFEMKPENVRQSVSSSYKDRVKEREAGTREKLSESLCIVPVVKAFDRIESEGVK